MSTAERGHLNDGLKLMQLGQMRLSLRDAGPRTQELKAWVGVDVACVMAQMGHSDEARSNLAVVRQGWQAPNADDEADMNWVTALTELNLGRADIAQRLVAASVRHWEGTKDRRQAVLGRITLADLHVRAGDRLAPQLAHQAIVDVRELRSVRACERLRPLTQTLAARPEREYQQLAEFAHRSAAV